MEKSIIIRPITDLRYKITEIERICIEEGHPVFITKNGVNHLVVISQEYFNKNVDVRMTPAKIRKLGGEEKNR